MFNFKNLSAKVKKAFTSTRVGYAKFRINGDAVVQIIREERRRLELVRGETQRTIEELRFEVDCLKPPVDARYAALAIRDLRLRTEAADLALQMEKVRLTGIEHQINLLDDLLRRAADMATPVPDGTLRQIFAR